ncbi:MAG: right-handed parallel beta-helix repeat-containing protein [Acetobacteraceae bacterium]|nr:right-handed parallel beta-helix repeat-containing protein [Acetobacteraceae bacterium]
MSSVTIPAGADIQAAIDSHPAGTVFQLSAGVYRGQHFLAQPNDQFIGAPGGGTILSGALVLSRWTAEGQLWKIDGLPPPFPGHGEPGNNPLATSREDLFLDNTLYHRVGSIAEITAKHWYFDQATRTAYLADDPHGHVVEYSATPNLTFDNGATGAVVSHLTIEKYATDAQSAPIHGVRGWHIIDVTSRLNHGAGLNIGAGTVVQGGHYIDNGQIGIAGWRADNSQVLRAEIARNNYAGYNMDWEAGGMKLAGSSDVIVSGNNVHDNHGTGLWSDIGDRSFIYTGNVVTNNAGNGIMYEISYGPASIRDNVASCNKGAQIYISNSQGVDVAGNRVVVGAESAGIAGGISMIYIDRGSGFRGAYELNHNSVHNNLIIHLGNGQDGIWLYDKEQPISGAVNQWDSNSYRLTDGSLPRWHFGQMDYTWQEMRKDTEFERHGTVTVLDKSQLEHLCPTGEVSPTGSIGIDATLALFAAILSTRSPWFAVDSA